ncbi:MAG: stage V sporulation protein AE [Clostridia bacterium]|nr:stage V sporulation protein AE [Clostridia bacterium]
MGRKVIAITDGDQLAEKAVAKIAEKIGARFISRSAGNPTPLSGRELVEMIKGTPHDPVVVLLDDRGHHGVGKGEAALAYLAKHPDIELIGVVAVASNIPGAKGTPVDFSITNEGKIYKGPVNKDGDPSEERFLTGDTVSVLPELSVPLIVGTGDTGKMGGKDAHQAGSPITLKAVETILTKVEELNRDRQETGEKRN